MLSLIIAMIVYTWDDVAGRVDGKDLVSKYLRSAV